MKNTQVTNPDNIVVQSSNEEVLMETENSKVVNQVDSEIEKEPPLDLVKKIIPLAQKGHEISFNNKELSLLFLEIYISAKGQLLPIVEKLSDFETLTDELKKAGDWLAKIIDYSDKGFQLTDVPEEQQALSDEEREYSEEHLLFAEILMIADSEIRMHIPTPIEK